MQLTNKKLIFDIPSLSDEWIFHVNIFFDFMDNTFYVLHKSKTSVFNYIGSLTIFHTMIGDINRFDVTFRDFNTSSEIFETTVKPIFEKYCAENTIELHFDYIYLPKK